MEENSKITELDKESMEFIETELIPEMVNDRCFCEIGSREFVELESVSVKLFINNRKLSKNCQLYEAKVIVSFSGEPKNFDIIIKLLPLSCQQDAISYGYFLNEEMFYNKMISKFKLDIYPKCYVADMGRYGRPVIVLEDLRAVGYNHYRGKLDEDHQRLLLEAIASFHGHGINLKEREFNIFREFYAKLSDVGGDKVDYLGEMKRSLEHLKRETSTISQNIINKIENTKVICEPNENPFFTICHGNLNLDNSLFLYKDGTPISVKIIGWNKMNYTCLMIDLEYLLFDNSQGIKSLPQLHKNCHDYIDAIVRNAGGVPNQLLSLFLLTLVYPRVITSTEMRNDSQVVDFLSSLR